MLIKAESIGVTIEDFWFLTPFQFYVKCRGYEEKMRYDNTSNIALINIVKSMFGSSKLISFDDLLGIKTLADYNLKTFRDFKNEDGSIDFKAFKQYLSDTVTPIKEQLGLM